MLAKQGINIPRNSSGLCFKSRAEQGGQSTLTPLQRGEAGSGSDKFTAWRFKPGFWLECKPGLVSGSTALPKTAHTTEDPTWSVSSNQLSFTPASIRLQLKTGLHCHSDTATRLRLLRTNRQKRRKNKKIFIFKIVTNFQNQVFLPSVLQQFYDYKNKQKIQKGKCLTFF